MSEDQELRERLGRLAGPVDLAGVWVSIEARAVAAGAHGAAGGAGHAGFLGRMRAIRTRTVVLGALAVVLLAAVAVGGAMAVLHARGSQVLVIGDDPAGMGAPAGSAADPGKWERLPLTWDGGPVHSIAIDPSDPSVIYAGTGEGVYKSTDGAESWSQVLADGIGHYAISIDPQDPAHVFASRVGPTSWTVPGVWRSPDGGETWTDLGSTVLGETIRRDWTENRGGAQPYARFDISTNPSTVYVFQESGWLQSTDYGETWVQVDNDEMDEIQRRLIGDPYSLDHALFGLGESEGPPVIVDPADGTKRVAQLAVADPDDSAVIYVGTQEGIYKSTDGAATWERRSDGLTCSAVTTLLVAPDGSSTLYAVTPREMWKSSDGGATWGAILSGAALDLEIHDSDSQEGTGASWTWDSGSLVVAPSDPSTLYAWTLKGLLRSDDGGEEWTHLDPQGLPPASFELDGNGFDHKLLLVSATDPDIVFAQARGGMMARSTDGGRTWTALPEAPWNLIPDPNEPSTLYGVGLYAEDRQTVELLLRKSVDTGATWMTISEAAGPDQFAEVFVDASQVPSVLYAGMWHDPTAGMSLQRSVDGGVTWQAADPINPPGGSYQLLFDPVSPGTVFADTHEFPDERYARGLYRSTDGGASWESILGEKTGDESFQLVMDPAKGTLFACSEAGVFRWDPDAE